MDNKSLEASKSSSRDGNGNANNDNSKIEEGKEAAGGCQQQQKPNDSKLALPQVLEDLDRFFDTISTTEDKSNPPRIPSSMESLFKMTENTITQYDSGAKFGRNQEEEMQLIQSVNLISRLINSLAEFAPNPETTSSLNKGTKVLYLAMSFLASEFRSILDSKNRCACTTPKASKPPSLGSIQEQDRCLLPETQSKEDEFPGYSLEEVTRMNKIATAMISSGYESECRMLYHNLRRNFLNAELEKFGFGNISVDHIHRMQWESLEGEIAKWINVIKHCSSVLLSAEHKLCSSIFSEYPLISQKLFGDLTLAVNIKFLNFAEAITLTERSTEKLFKILDMYETLGDLIPTTNNNVCPGNCESESARKLKSEICAVQMWLGEAAVSIFCDLENSIRRDNSRTPVPSGVVHPLTRYTMNYLEYACEYKDTLEQVFQDHCKMERSCAGESYSGPSADIKNGANEDGTPKTSPFSVQLNTVMDLLDENLEMKSKLYRDPSLRYVFLMNNGRYILQKIKGSNDIHDMIGMTWCRKRSSDLRMYHKSYKRETWSRVLQCLSHEGVQVNGKVTKTLVKERFKMFNTMFEEIHRTQSTWVVSDKQLQSELRVSVSAVVIPAYRSFLGRFKQYFQSSKQAEKYIRYQPEDVENLIEELFDGNPTSMGRRRT